MYYIYYQALVFTIFGAVYLTRQLSSNHESGLWYSICLLIGTFHLSLLKYEISPLLYIWFWMALMHFIIHGFDIYWTIMKNVKFTVDDLWHFGNQCMAGFYLTQTPSNEFTTKIYFASVILYLAILFTWVLKGDSAAKALKTFTPPFIYYFSALLEPLFIFTLEPWNWLYMIGLFFFFLVTYIITIDHPIGKQFVYGNVAGCAFMGEFSLLYLMHNHLV